jgi:hypothetical protein
VLAADVARPVLDGTRMRPGTVLWSEAYAGAWEASSRGRALPHRRVFGWANGYQLSRPGPVSFSYANQWFRYPVVLMQLALVIGAWLLWRGSWRFHWPFRRRRADAEVDAGAEADSS